jgi:mitochondrial fission protein ELM1
MKNLKKIWVLTDNRIGSNVQAIALANRLGQDYSIIDVSYNFLSKIPNILMPKNFYQIKDPNFKELIKINKPSLVISASRRTALVSAAIKKFIPSVKNCHILKPDISYNNFDLVVLPEHDNIPKNLKNVFKVFGSLCDIHPKIESSIEEFSKNYPEQNYVSVLVGGDTKKFNFNANNSFEFADKILKLSQSCDSKFIITYSRRTPKCLKDEFEKIKNDNFIIYDPVSSGFNPYPSMIARSKFVISTIDSISMCSEVASSGKPLYLLIPTGFNSEKHINFASKLVESGVARFIDADTDLLQEYNYTPLNEAYKVAEYMLSHVIGVK